MGTEHAPIEYLTASDAGHILGISVGQVRHLAKTGSLRIAATARSQGAFLFLPEDVEALRKEREKKPPRRGRRWPPKEVRDQLKEAKKVTKSRST